MENAEISVGIAVNGVEEGQANGNNEKKCAKDEEEEEDDGDEVGEYDEKERRLGSPLLAEEESEDEGLDEVVHEHEVRLQELREKEAKSDPVTIENSSDLDKRMEYLVSACVDDIYWNSCSSI